MRKSTTSAGWYVTRQARFMCHPSSVSWLWYLNNILLKPSKKSFWSQHFSSCCWTVVKKNMTVLLTLSWPYLACRPWNCAKPGWSRSGRLDERSEERHQRGAMTKGFACNAGSVSPVTYEDQLRQTSNDLETACLLMLGKHGVSVYLHTCVCVYPRPHNTIKLSQ